MAHINIAVFIPHFGCKNDCVFCNQKIITGEMKKTSVDDVKKAIEEFIEFRKNNNENKTEPEIEIAFFGGSFTGLDIDEMIGFLQTAAEYIGNNGISGIRLSTRPDYISESILDILGTYGVTSIELGVQSMFDDVLTASQRGHTKEDTIRACKLIKERNFALTGQIMLGLPNSTREKDIETAHRLIPLGIKSARIYPTIVFRDTLLNDMYNKGDYDVISLDEAVFRAKEIKKIFDKNKIKILRMGLCASDNMSNTDLFAGPYHPSFGELVESEIIFDELCDEIVQKDISKLKGIKIAAEKRNISKVIGNKRKNIIRLKERFNIDNIEVEVSEISVNMNSRKNPAVKFILM